MKFIQQLNSTPLLTCTTLHFFNLNTLFFFCFTLFHYHYSTLYSTLKLPQVNLRSYYNCLSPLNYVIITTTYHQNGKISSTLHSIVSTAVPLFICVLTAFLLQTTKALTTPFLLFLYTNVVYKEYKKWSKILLFILPLAKVCTCKTALFV